MEKSKPGALSQPSLITNWTLVRQLLTKLSVTIIITKERLHCSLGLKTSFTMFLQGRRWDGMKAYQASGHQKTFNFTLCLLYCRIYTQPPKKIYSWYLWSQWRVFQWQDASQYLQNKLNLIISSFVTIQMNKEEVNQACHSGKWPV